MDPISVTVVRVPHTATRAEHSTALKLAGGRLVVCEFSAPTNEIFRTVYLEYLMKALPRISEQVSSSPDAYVYLAESIRAWPDQDSLAEVIASSGWERVQYRNLTGGIVALHRGWRPQIAGFRGKNH